MGIRQRLDELKKRRRSVRPDEIHALLTHAGFDRRFGRGDHWHARLRFPLTIDPRNPLLPVYVSKAIRLIEEALVAEEETDGKDA
jgi:hypothetical protein